MIEQSQIDTHIAQLGEEINRVRLSIHDTEVQLTKLKEQFQRLQGGVLALANLKTLPSELPSITR